MKIRINGEIIDLPKNIVEYLRLSRYRDSRRKSNVVSIRFTPAELQKLEAWHRDSNNLQSFSVFLHDKLNEQMNGSLNQLMREYKKPPLNKSSTSRRLRWWK